MATASRARHDKTFADVLALGEDARVELIDGEIVPKAAPTFVHGRAQAATSGWLFDRFGGDNSTPPTWYFATEVDTELTPDRVVRPDVAGWRASRVAEAQLVGRPVLVIPDWICEVLSPSNRSHDLVTKVQFYHAARVPHYWVLDPDEHVLTVHRWTERGYLLALGAGRREKVSPEPFGVEVTVERLLGSWSR